MSQGEALIHGLSHGIGVVVGRCVIVSSPEEMTKIEYGDIVIIDAWDRDLCPPYENYLARAAALVENGSRYGFGNRIMTYRFKKPCISGTQGISKAKATDILKDGQMVMIITPSGRIEKPSSDGPIFITVGTVFEYSDEDKDVKTFREMDLPLISQSSKSEEKPVAIERITMRMKDRMNAIREKYNMTPLNFSWIIDGKLAGHSEPTSQEDLDWLWKQGISALVRMAKTPKVNKHLIEQMGFSDCHEPVPDCTAPSLTQVKKIVECIESSLVAGKPVGISCEAGLGRTGTILACYLVSQGYEADVAINEVRVKRPGSIETQSQEDIIKAYSKQF